jgi:hypothetical protein
MLDQLMATASRQQQTALQSEAAGDTASLMARYGARLALGSATPSRTAATPFAGIR